MKIKYLVATLIALYGIGSIVIMMGMDSEIVQKEIIIDNQHKTIEYLTAKYLGTNYEQELLKEANKLLKERQ